MKLITEFLYLVSLLVFTFPARNRMLETKVMKCFPITKKGWMMWCGVLIHHGNFEQWRKDKGAWMRLNIRLYQAKTHHFSWTTFYLTYWLDMLKSMLKRRTITTSMIMKGRIWKNIDSPTLNVSSSGKKWKEMLRSG